MVTPQIRVVSGDRIDTERLALRPPARMDARRLAELIGPWEIAKWLVRVPFPYREEHALAWIERSMEERAAGVGWPFMIRLRDTGEMIGAIDLSLEPDRKSGSLGYWLTESHWGRGYGTEAARAMVDFGFENLRLEQVTASSLPENERSMQVLRKAGLVYVDHRPEDTVERGRVDTAFFALDRRAWAARR